LHPRRRYSINKIGIEIPKTHGETHSALPSSVFCGAQSDPPILSDLDLFQILRSDFSGNKTV
jgi:hypothetical protein